ncbi:anthranilate phosphoribosyltransferase [Aquamicrobium segne]|uniref:Anthranilate phosphoribosyltransferase n=1 Tax=Aquamicrobium segne TaxID=469547 RepID=A0ABW0GYM5_9HYPH
MSSTLKPFIASVSSGKPLNFEEAREAFDIIMSGDATPGQVGGFLMGLRVRGETVDEISGAVETMRAKMLPVSAPANAVDIVGTGGDGLHSYNISTASAFVMAASGVPVAKHGNRSLSSLTGTADVLTALGVNIELPPEAITRCIKQAGIGFMFAPSHHPAMKHVGPVRVELGIRTIFNLVGPLTNPARVHRQLVGVFAPEWVVPAAEALKALGSTHAWVVHGDGYDEITTTGETMVAELVDGKMRNFTLTPEMLGLGRYTIEDLRGGDAQTNARALRGVLSGEQGAYHDTVLMNAGAGLVVAGLVKELDEGVARARKTIASGRAIEVLEKLIEVSNA